METGFPPCLVCATGVLIPFSDYGERGADIYYKSLGVHKSRMWGNPPN